MKTLKLIDMTLAEAGAIREGALTFKEKLEIARILDRLKVDIIELPPISSGKADQLSNKTIAAMVQTAITADVDIIDGDVELLEIAFKLSAEAGAQHISYIRGIYEHWGARGICSPDDYWENEADRDMQSGKVHRQARIIINQKAHGSA